VQSNFVGVTFMPEYFDNERKFTESIQQTLESLESAKIPQLTVRIPVNKWSV
jgi:hypothetical protein